MRALRAMLVLTHCGVYRRPSGAIKALRRSPLLSARAFPRRRLGPSRHAEKPSRGICGNLGLCPARGYVGLDRGRLVPA